ncbi:Nodule Cysteine-Rich (NCR) secreted peptide [Medicago truncatula]|uniref:Nodule Cysteine-Rich (NCR) secreted peptide n=2 Tax=Medicago truncatula TaxID=3880 RepID=A0A072U6V1_MEDTR|nr:Nodule Cysteine-Rich (NCR) secreted peptide [Medicago truncatula]
MARNLKFIYVMVLFLALFFVLTNGDSFRGCNKDTDCPEKFCSSPDVVRCIYIECYCI